MTENVFVAIYTLECLVRINHIRGGVFKNASDLFDVGIVITFVVDAWVLTPLGSSTDLNLLKFLRLIRLVRVIRLIR